MSAHRIAQRYAKSLLDQGIEQSDLDRIVQDMELVEKSLASRDLYLLMKSPIISIGKKKAIFKRIFGDKISKGTSAFFDIMIRKGREKILPEIVHAFGELYREHKHISIVKLETAVALDDSTIRSIREQLIASNQTLENIEMQVEVNPDLLGGFRLEFEGKEYDASIAYKLKQLRKNYTN